MMIRGRNVPAVSAFQKQDTTEDRTNNITAPRPRALLRCPCARLLPAAQRPSPLHSSPRAPIRARRVDAPASALSHTHATRSMAARTRAAAATAALLGLAALPLARARVYSGSFSGQTNPFVAKFAFGVGDGVVGNINVQYSNLPTSESSLALYEYDDDQWAATYGQVPCQQGLSNAATSLPMPTTAASVTGAFTETARPHFWFFTMANPGCSAGVYADWTVTLTQAE